MGAPGWPRTGLGSWPRGHPPAQLPRESPAPPEGQNTSLCPLATHTALTGARLLKPSWASMGISSVLLTSAFPAPNTQQVVNTRLCRGMKE